MAKQLEVVYDAGVLRPLEPLPFADQEHLLVSVIEADPERSFNSRVLEQQWLQANSSQFVGEWVALDGDQLVSHGKNGREVLAQAHHAGVTRPLVVHVPIEAEHSFAGW